MRVSLSAAAYHPPEHLVWSVLMVKPALHVEHMTAPFLVQAAPVLGEPFGQLHILAARDTHMCMPLGVHLATWLRQST